MNEISETDRAALQRAYNAICMAEHEIDKVTHSVVLIGMGAFLAQLQGLRQRLAPVAYPEPHNGSTTEAP